MRDLSPAQSESADRVALTARDYGAAFPAADAIDFAAHLAVTRSGSELQQTVSRFLAANFKINTARYSVLRALYFAPGHRLPQSEVARTMNVTSPNVTQLIDGLERDGFVQRIVSETDRRLTYAQLTPEGEARCAELVPAMAAFMAKTCAGLSKDEKADLVRILAKLRAHLATI